MNEKGNGYALSSVEGSKVTISDTCFTNNLFSGKGVVVVEGSTADFTASNVFGTIDEKLSCSFASISGESCVDYDSTSCTASSAFSSNSTSTTADDAATTGETDTAKNPSSSFSIKVGPVAISSFLLALTFAMGL